MARQRIFIYIGTLVFLLAFGQPGGGLIGIPISFFLKNKLHLTANMSWPTLSSLLVFPSTCPLPSDSFAIFGALLEWEIGGFMLLFGASTAGLYVFFAFTPVSSSMLLVESVLLTTSFLFVASAQNGLASTIGKQHVISGQVSAVWNIFTSISIIAALLLGGKLSSLLESENAEQTIRILFLGRRNHGLGCRLRRI